MRKRKVFILAGQSNMAGLAHISDLAQELRVAPENVAYPENKTYKRFAEPRFSPEVTFAHEIAKAWADEQILIVKFAVGATWLLAWAPDWTAKQERITTNNDEGRVYRKLIKYIKTAMEGIDPEFAGMLWMQGERDARFKEVAEQYAENLGELHHADPC